MEAPTDHLMVLACQISAITAQDLLFGPTLRRFPDLKVALSEGGIGWIPFYFDRIDRHYENQSWLHQTTSAASCPPRSSGTTSSPASSPILGTAAAGRIGIDTIAWECDYPHTDTTWPESPEFAWTEFQAAGCSDEEIHKITWENACRFFDWDPFATPRGTRRPSAPCGPGRRRRRHAHAARAVARAQRGRRHRGLPTSRAPTGPDGNHPVRQLHPCGGGTAVDAGGGAPGHVGAGRPPIVGGPAQLRPQLRRCRPAGSR